MSQQRQHQQQRLLPRELVAQIVLWVPAAQRLDKLRLRLVRDEAGSGSAQKGGTRLKMCSTREVCDRIEHYKRQQPSIFAREIRDRLIAENSICTPAGRENIPSVSTINRVLRSLHTKKACTVTNSTVAMHSDSSSSSSTIALPKKEILPDEDKNKNNSDERMGLKRKLLERIRTSFTQEQKIDSLEKVYERTRYPDIFMLEDLAARIGFPEARVKVWFKNRRAKWRREKRYGGTPAEQPNRIVGCGNGDEGNASTSTSAQSHAHAHRTPATRLLDLL